MRFFASFVVSAVCLLAAGTASAGSKGVFDGPAELPRITVASSMADTPAPGSLVTVRSGDNLQAVINNAFCGDTIELEAGAVFAGIFSLPAKRCDDAHWIIIRTSAPDTLLPAEGTRLTPCYAGVASLPGRPVYACANPQNVLARIENNTTAEGPLVLRDGANHYRLLGLEITRTAGLRHAPGLVELEPRGIADHIIVDRSWLHGTTHDETQVGVSLSGMSTAAVIDSYFSDFHCTYRTGACTDAHAVGGGLGSHQDGPFKISGNFLEASGEAVMFGGGAATLTPADIEIRRNHFFKPLTWMPGNPDFVGGDGRKPFIVKNHLELKNATRVLVEANIMENNWGGFTQSGYAVLLSPKNQHTKHHGNVCPRCQVTDITLRYSYIAHSGSGIQMATSISGSRGNGGPALAGERWSIHDVVLEDINKNYTGGGNLFLIMNGWTRNPVNTITISHVTGFPDVEGHLALFGNDRRDPEMFGLVFSNNLVATGRYPVWSSGGGLSSCAAKGTPARKISKCFSSYTFRNNALIGTPDAFPPSSWPAGNLFPASMKAVDFDNQAGGDVADYQLQPKSPYRNAGTDGRDLGADIPGLVTALADVE